ELVGILMFGAAGGLWLLLLFFDPLARGRGRRFIMGAGIFALSYMIAMTVYGYVAKYRLAGGLFLLLAISVCAGTASAQAPNTCLDCHGALDPPLQVTAEQFARDIHAQKGLTCASCHGGDPTKADMDAMSKAAGFRGKVQRGQIPELCGRCHSDSSFMRQYNPSLRTDQLSQYKTSVHGQRLAHGDTKVAVCIDC